jgi:hypothetical protein
LGEIFDSYRAHQPIGWQRDDVRFYFDNEEILEDETPAELGMQDQDEIETTIVSEEKTMVESCPEIRWPHSVCVLC